MPEQQRRRRQRLLPPLSLPPLSLPPVPCIWPGFQSPAAQIKETASLKDAAAPKLAWKAAAAPAGAPAGVTCREVTLPKLLAKKGTAKLTALAAYTHVLRPEPAEVGDAAWLSAVAVLFG